MDHLLRRTKNPQIGAQHTPENQATRLHRCESKIPRSRIEFSVLSLRICQEISLAVVRRGVTIVIQLLVVFLLHLRIFVGKESKEKACELF